MRRMVLALALAIVGGCRGGASGTGPRPPVTESSPPVALDAGLPVDAGAVLPMPALRPVLDDPRLAVVRDIARQGDPARTAQALEGAAKANPPAPSDACGWSYLLGLLWTSAGDSARAAAAFDRVSGADAGPPCPLAAYALLRGAQAHARALRGDEAITRARAIGDRIAVRDEATIVLAEALAAKGNVPEAVPLWRALLAKNPRGNRWVDTAARLARALVDGAAGDPAPVAQEAYELATRVVLEAPDVADSSGATTTRARAVSLLRAKRPELTTALSDDELARQAKGWLDAGNGKRAQKLAGELLPPRRPKAQPSDPTCRAASVRAQATPRAKGGAADAWGQAIAFCDKNEGLAQALSSGAKASAQAHRPAEAVERYGRLEQVFPAHRLADDARFHAAVIALDQGDEATFVKLLTTLPDLYPQGDMRGEALFRVALLRISQGDFPGAREPLERIASFGPDHHWASAGRAAYFRARVAAATGDEDGAMKRYEAVVREHPLAFYMLLALGRVAEKNPGRAKQLLDEAIVQSLRESAPRPRPELHTPAFQVAMRLLEVGETDAAKRELGTAGLLDGKADPEVAWFAGALFDAVGVPEVGHAIARSRLGDAAAHFPVGRFRLAWAAAFPMAFEPLVVKEADANAIPRELAWAIVREESSFVADAKSSAAAYGLMQLIVPTAQHTARGTGITVTEAELKRPDVSIALGTRHLAQLRKRYAANPALAIPAYNAGPGAVDRWLQQRDAVDFDLWVEQIPWEETRNYTKRVLASQAAYAFLASGGVGELAALPVHGARGTAR